MKTEALELQRNLKFSLLHGLSFSLMVGLGETYVVAFALALGFHALQAGLLASVPLMVGGFMQLATPWAVTRLGSYKRWVLLMASIQACAFLPLAYFAYEGSAPLFLLYLVVSIYWSTGMSISPAWNAWLNALVPRRVRVGFFTKRTFFTHAGTLIGLLVGGFTLQNFDDGEHGRLQGFLWMFLCCFAVRMLCVGLISAQSDVSVRPKEVEAIRLSGAFTHLRKSEHGRILIYLLMLLVAVHISGPFFSPFMLMELKMGYQHYMFMLATAYVAKVVMFPILTRYAERVGIARLFFWSSIGVIPMPLGWLVSENDYYLYALQFVSGATWGIHELMSFLLLFNQIPQKERTGLLSIFNFMSTFSLGIGSAVGAYIFSHAGSEYSYAAVFGASALLRLICLFFFPGFQANAKEIRYWIYTRSISVRPALGGMGRPIIASAIFKRKK